MTCFVLFSSTRPSYYDSVFPNTPAVKFVALRNEVIRENRSDESAVIQRSVHILHGVYKNSTARIANLSTGVRKYQCGPKFSGKAV